jgi:hypothetical protein
MRRQNKKNVTFMDFYLEAIQVDFGEEKDRNLCENIIKRVTELGEIVDDRGNETVHRHIYHNILPVAACYELLKESGMSPESALIKASGLMHDIARKQIGSIRKITKLLFSIKSLKKLFLCS